VLKVAVVGDAGCDEGMGDLHQQRPPAAQQERRLAVDAPADRARTGEGGHAWCEHRIRPT